MRKTTSTCILGVLLISLVWSATSGRQLAGQEFATLSDQYAAEISKLDEHCRDWEVAWDKEYLLGECRLCNSRRCGYEKGPFLKVLLIISNRDVIEGIYREDRLNSVEQTSCSILWQQCCKLWGWKTTISNTERHKCEILHHLVFIVTSHQT